MHPSWTGEEITIFRYFDFGGSLGSCGSEHWVLLPDITPSLAVHHLAAIFETSVDLPPPADSGTVAVLRSQIAQAEHIAKCRIRETDELARQISVLEQQLCISIETREWVDEEQAVSTVSLRMS
ncbi:hypothetical protein HD554DRAFT_1263980 [Boletus coccyginus]|nr:hypothetical protein HD554DRAFT_1263980 [Boletus coccyginus]